MVGKLFFSLGKNIKLNRVPRRIRQKITSIRASGGHFAFLETQVLFYTHQN